MDGLCQLGFGHEWSGQDHVRKPCVGERLPVAGGVQSTRRSRIGTNDRGRRQRRSILFGENVPTKQFLFLYRVPFYHPILPPDTFSEWKSHLRSIYSGSQRACPSSRRAAQATSGASAGISGVPDQIRLSQCWELIQVQAALVVAILRKWQKARRFFTLVQRPSIRQS